MTEPIRARERGFVLLFSLFLAIVLGALGVAMLRGASVRERVAGNAIDKQRALRVAEDALQYAETWLVREQGDVAVQCTGVTDASKSGRLRVCSSALGNPSELPWPERTENLPRPGGQLPGNTAPPSAVHIAEVGVAGNGLTRYYQITAVGYGEIGTPGAGAVAVLRSTFKLGTAARNLGVP